MSAKSNFIHARSLLKDCTAKGFAQKKKKSTSEMEISRGTSNNCSIADAILDINKAQHGQMEV